MDRFYKFQISKGAKPTVRTANKINQCKFYLYFTKPIYYTGL